ncbi:endonuclease [Cohaesibacter gelatinilyticus]|uniref:Predicted 5' DNA nuclease, flap endonuclease-1-like, helix-3-turn-helix (H3TH) domain n=1 Tax=Cohaesibacter gelatinilyticus TaxID=372072 RepID=A0A285N9Y2_9HYPH|nr:endonuclease [Cohaesibacter gelatinilyticus]SNZ06275.1 Predicted 5' DNA nuclease, flap endonuclease-1-like, helix-3-turn-helix (H3TH) domain [Cohaesibacter gelatinilyticus]
MFALVWQEILLIALSVLIGMPIGCLLRRWFGGAKSADVVQDQDAMAAKAFQLAQETEAQLAAEDIAPAVETDGATAEAEPAISESTPVEIQTSEEVVAVADRVEEESAPAETLSEEDLAAEEEKMATALAALPKDASAEDKANLVGNRPSSLLDAPRNGSADDLKQIKGVGKVIEGKLNGLGIYHFDQIANLSRKEINWITTFLSFKGRIDREDWIGQARILSEGGETEFSKRAQKTKLYD